MNNKNNFEEAIYSLNAVIMTKRTLGHNTVFPIGNTYGLQNESSSDYEINRYDKYIRRYLWTQLKLVCTLKGNESNCI